MVPLPVDIFELFILLLLFVLILLLLIGAIALTELLIEVGGKIPDEDVVKPGKKSKKNDRLLFKLVKFRFLQKVKEFI